MARPVQTFIFLLAVVLLPACFRSKAKWQASGERSKQSTITLNKSSFTVAHGKTAELEITGGSGTYSCEFVDSVADSGTLTMSYSGSLARCQYAAPASGKKLELGVKITDAKFAERNVVGSIYVPASGTPDNTFSDSAVGTLVGKLYSSTTLDTEVASVLEDANGKYLVGSHQRGVGGKLQVRRLNPDGSLDTSFNSTGIFEFGYTNPCGTSAGTPPLVKKMALEHNGSGIRVAFEQSVHAYVIRLRSDGTLDTSWGGMSTNFGLGNAGPTVPGLNGCSDLRNFGNDGFTYSMNLATMFLDSADNMYFAGYKTSPSLQLNIRKVLPTGHTFRQMTWTPPNQTPAVATPFFNSGAFFEIDGRTFLGFPVKAVTGGIASLALFHFEESGLALQLGTYLGGQGLLLNTSVDMAGADADVTPWTLKQIEVETDGRLFFTGHVSYNDAAGTNDLNTFVHGNLKSLPDALTTMVTNPDGFGYVPTSATTLWNQHTLNIPQRSPFGGLYASPESESRGFAKAMRQSDGAYLMLGTSEQDSNFVMPIMARLLPGFSGALETDFGLAQGNAGDAFDQRWQLELTEFGGERGAFKTGQVLSDGRYLAGGYIQFGGYNGGLKAGWLSRYWP